jgi:hypothetical protein
MRIGVNDDDAGPTKHKSRSLQKGDSMQWWLAGDGGITVSERLHREEEGDADSFQGVLVSVFDGPPDAAA